MPVFEVEVVYQKKVRLMVRADNERDSIKAAARLARKHGEFVGGTTTTPPDTYQGEDNKVGTHVSHCCKVHGCKYGDHETCPVTTGTYSQDYLCEACYEDFPTD